MPKLSSSELSPPKLFVNNVYQKLSIVYYFNRILLQDATIANNKLLKQPIDRFKKENLLTDNKIVETLKIPDL